PGVRERVLNVVRELLEELGSHGAVSELSEKSNLDRDLGLGSLERVELLTRLEGSFDVRLPDTLAAEASRPADLIHAILVAPGAPETEVEEFPAARDGAATQQRPTEEGARIVDKAETLVEVIRLRGVHDAQRTHLIISEDDPKGEQQYTLTFG